MVDNKIRLVVFKEYALGYIFPEQPRSVHMLSCSPLKGCPFGSDGSSAYLSNEDDVRLASADDFNEYRVLFDGYKNSSDYVYAESNDRLIT